MPRPPKSPMEGQRFRDGSIIFGTEKAYIQISSNGTVMIGRSHKGFSAEQISALHGLKKSVSEDGQISELVSSLKLLRFGQFITSTTTTEKRTVPDDPILAALQKILAQSDDKEANKLISKFGSAVKAARKLLGSSPIIDSKYRSFYGAIHKLMKEHVEKENLKPPRDRMLRPPSRRELMDELEIGDFDLSKLCTATDFVWL
jgi:hypothetical protein